MGQLSAASDDIVMVIAIPRAESLPGGSWETNDEKAERALVLRAGTCNCSANDWFSRTRGPRFRVRDRFRFHILCGTRRSSRGFYHIFCPSPPARGHSDEPKYLVGFLSLATTSAPTHLDGAERPSKATHTRAKTSSRYARTPKQAACGISRGQSRAHGQ